MAARIRKSVAQLGYRPPGGYRLDLEVLSASELRRRASATQLQAPHRLKFHQLIAVTEGQCTHLVDFVPYACAVGTWIIVRPGQVQRFSMASQWKGWLIVFRPELLLPLQSTALEDHQAFGYLDALPNRLMLDVAEHRACLTSIRQMADDARIDGRSAERNALLRHQLHAVILRLHLVQRRSEEQADASPANRQRFERFRQAVEKHFGDAHRVRDYAKRIGCSERSLTRATLQSAGVTAKAFLRRRIVLEAMRLLARTDRPVSVIALEIGFEDPSNFVKFFKREANCVPGAFRRRHAAG